MTYEYSSESRRLDFSNPFTVENLFIFAVSAVMIFGALATLLMSRSGLSAERTAWTLVPFGVGIYLLVCGVAYARRGLLQLRFYFGRGEPRDLGRAADIKETLRQNALQYEEPKGALNGLLYSLIPDLIFAPAPIQHVAQRQFHNGLATMATLLSFGASMIFVQDPVSAAVLGMFYLAFSVFLLLRPLDAGANAQAAIGVRGLIALILVAIFGPILIPLVGSHLPDVTWLHLGGQTAAVLAVTLASEALFFKALTKQMIKPPRATTACEQAAVSFNAHPKQLVDELARELQRDWAEQIPNRSYSYAQPQISGETGSFYGEILEETQPMPRQDMRQVNLKDSLSLPRYKWLTLLSAFGLAACVIGVASLIAFAAQVEAGVAFHSGVVSYLTFGLAMMIVTGFCFKAGHALWGRFDFVSELIWVQLDGNFQQARMGYGNQLTDRVKSEKQVINVETMTLRVWVASIETVSFGKNADRMVIGMCGDRDRAQYLVQHLARFAMEQSTLVAPTAPEDLKKVQGLGTINQLGASGHVEQSAARIAEAIGGDGASKDREEAIAATPVTARHVVAAGCDQCDTEMAAGGNFCSHCGTALTAA